MCVYVYMYVCASVGNERKSGHEIERGVWGDTRGAGVGETRVEIM